MDAKTLVLYLCINNKVKTYIIINATEVCNHCVLYVLCRCQSFAYVVELLWFSFCSLDQCHLFVALLYNYHYSFN